jgi:hypothetical protein
VHVSTTPRPAFHRLIHSPSKRCRDGIAMLPFALSRQFLAPALSVSAKAKAKYS